MLLIFVEDPGAVNFITPLIPALIKNKYSYTLLASGKACALFKKNGISFTQHKKQAAHKIFKKYKPQTLLVGTSENINSLGFKLTELAKNNKITSVSVVDAAMNAQYRFSAGSNNPFKYITDYLIVPNQLTKNNFVKHGFKKKNIFICGQPWKAEIQKKLFAWKGKKENIKNKLFPSNLRKKKILLFLSEISEALDPNINKKGDFLFKGNGAHERSKIIFEEFLLATNKLSPKPSIILRLHPKDNIHSYSKYLQDIDFVSQKEDAHEVLFASDLVVGITTTLLSESLFMNIPTLAVIPRRLELQWLPEVVNRTMPFAITRQQLQSKINTLTKNKITHKNEKKSEYNYPARMLEILNKIKSRRP